jgi:hypothetical protein
VPATCRVAGASFADIFGLTVMLRHDAPGTLRDGDVEQRVKEVGRHVARFADLHPSEQVQDFRRAWGGAVANPGGAKD